MGTIKLIPTLVVKCFAKIVFFISSILFPVNPNKITFASYRSTKLSGNLAYIYDEIERRDESFTTVLLFKKYHSSILGKFDYVIHMVQSCYHLATSRFFIIDDFYFPIYLVKPRKRTEIVQLWHATGAFKKFGYSTVNKKFGPSKEYLKYVNIHSNYNCVFVSSSEIIPHYAEAFNMDIDKIHPLGVPRTDFFFQVEKHEHIKSRFFEKYPELMNKKIILYAPTFRGKSHYQEQFDCPIDFSTLHDKLGDEYCLLVHLHPYMNQNIEIDETAQRFTYQITNEFDINELMIVSDILLTDYSSVIFEFSLLQRPIAFIATDLEEYLEERDFYYEYTSFIPGPFFEKTEPLADWILDGNYNLEQVLGFRNRFFTYTDGQATKRIVDYLLDTNRLN